MHSGKTERSPRMARATRSSPVSFRTVSTYNARERLFHEDKPMGLMSAEQTAEGEFRRQPDAFRGWVTADGRSGYPAAEGRYRLDYENVNDGVYRAGFATSQQVYERAVRRLFDALDRLDARLRDRRYLFGSRFVETDWRLFVTLIRFDAVYHGHFKCNLRRIVDYPNLFGYLKDLYRTDGIAHTVKLDHIKRHYYITHDDINPTRIVPLGPDQDLRSPHGRERLS